MRRVAVLLAIGFLLAPPLAPAGAAAPECNGRKVTIKGHGLIRGTAGNDVILGSSGSDVIRAGRGSDHVCAGGGDDRIAGGAKNDEIAGGPGSDVLLGGTGVDELEGGAGDDRLNGSGGRDVASFGDSSAAVTVDLAAGTASGDGADVLVSMEDVYGSRFGDDITGDGGPNFLSSLYGDDVVEGGDGRDWVWGWVGNDRLSGGGGDDQVWGSEGDDVVRGDAGSDTLMGEEGDDLFDGGPNGDTADFSRTFDEMVVNLATGVATGEGTDVLTAVENVVGSLNADRIVGDENANRLYGDYGGDQITGLGGDDVLAADWCCGPRAFALDGGAGDDWLIAEGTGDLQGGTGDDRLTATTHGSTLDGGPGTDVADYARVFGIDLPSGGVSSSIEVDLRVGIARSRNCSPPCAQDTLVGIEGAAGDWGDDLLIGDHLPNRLTGGDGNDEIVAGEGDDVLDGGDDFFDGDTGDGGGGNDRCIGIEHATGCESTG